MTRTKGDFRRAHPTRGAIDPQDGDVREVLVDFANGVTWAFKYREGSPSKYRWEFIGGGPLLKADGTTFTPGSTAFQNNSGPQITLPFSGEYKTNIWAQMENGSSGLTAILGVNIAGSALINGSTQNFVGGFNDHRPMSYVLDYQDWAAGTIINVGYQSTVASVLAISGRVLEILPRRVAL